RKKLRENGISFKVYKNKLIKRVVENRADAGEMMKLLDHLKGPTGVAFSQSDPIVATKLFADYASENEKFSLKAACYEKSYWDASTMKQMSQLGSKSAIYGRLISTMKAPLFKLVYVLQSPSSKLVGTLKAVSEKS
ncbi:MAG TPA: 50S ribosomal protein L10, partial [bacterium]|nr:50S ribosomal protein L10 [bacterium]